ncbi:CubicO group peptidase (beta-lactamase class C family) [Mycobacterium frederiksbergense]|uniref:CubicO group peptidase (Beta-lactamase class C family) n=1 Tax=Mycolicibacterium frederiksbergense TaxID=117567 RepID=A0ABT6KU48_9MYCO|nr:serine hydrolase domain-containing protein [Mycolicibacterium frederiksbergense]MDH6194118.1 CubicO group peptidase (beta-lactamase class C family) [Mycolicibacterium frederiksbergense]
MVGLTAGSADPAFAGVREVFEASFVDGLNWGASVAVVIGGRPVVDLWGGVADIRTGRRWQRDTACVTFSCTKAVTATAALMVAEREAINLEAPVTSWWPEFGVADKGAITGEHLLSHAAGLPAVERPVSIGQAADPELMAGLLADQEPLWEPGSCHGYHAFTFGWLAGEIVRRHVKMTVGEFVRSYISEDLMIGASLAALDGIARTGFPDVSEQQWTTHTNAIPATTVEQLADAYQDPQSLLTRATTNPPARYNHPDVLTAGWPASGLITTARALAQFYARLGAGELLHPENLNNAIRPRNNGSDAVMVLDSSYGLGYMRPSQMFVFPDNAGPGAFGHPGAGGAFAFADVDNQLALAFVPNLRRDLLAGDRRALDLVEATYAAL